MSTVAEATTPIAFSERAVSEIQSLLAQEGRPEDALRVFVAGQGCSGLQYGMGIEDSPGEDDLEFSQFGLRVVIDSQSVKHMAGASVDFVDGPDGGGFRIDNPNAPEGCGCGSGEGGGCSGCG